MDELKEDYFSAFENSVSSESEIYKQSDSLEIVKSEETKDAAKEVTKDYVLTLVNQLKSTSWREVYKALGRIRSRVIQTDAGISLLKECKGFKSLVKYLSVKNEEMLNVVLSILGNCCSKLVGNQDLREDVLKYGIAAQVVGVLKKPCSESTQRRACRLVGNLAQARNLGVELHKAGATSTVLHILNSTNDSQVKQMAVRALRWLWETDKYHTDMLNVNAVASVAALMNTEDPELRPLVLRALVVFTQPCSSKTAEQMKGEGGSGYVQIVKLMGEQVTSVIVCNLSHSPPARVELTKAGVVPAIIDKLDGGNIINSYLITALCVMCRESMVRASLRVETRGFPTLLSLLGNKKAKMFHAEVLAAITQFNYDQQSLMMMVSGGLIGLLVGKLGEMSGEPHEEEYARSTVNGGSSSGGESPGSPPCWSPPPPSSPPVPLYSPSCSPTYPDDSITWTLAAQQMEKYCSGSEVALGEDGCILEVLSQLTYQNIPLRPLATKATITTFLDYLTTLSYPRSAHNYIKASKILASIVSCKHYYNSLLEDESILAVHRALCRPRHSNCDWCSRLKATGRWVLGEARLAAQSGLGEGEMMHRLSAGPHPTTALTIPHVVNQPKLLFGLLFGHKGFQCILDALDNRIDEAVPALYELFTTLRITNPQKAIETCSSCDIGGSRKESTISFRLDDGSTVSANKESLAHNCPMFEAMFRGGFMEALQTTIRLTEISWDCLTHLTRLADEYCSCILPKDLSTLLEMVSAADRFLLPELSQKALSHVMNSALSPATAHRIYDWGLTYQAALPVTNGVPLDVVCYILSADMLTSQRVEAVRRIVDGPNRARFLEQVMKIVSTGLRTYMKTFKFHEHPFLRSFPTSPVYFLH